MCVNFVISWVHNYVSSSQIPCLWWAHVTMLPRSSSLQCVSEPGGSLSVKYYRFCTLKISFLHHFLPKKGIETVLNSIFSIIIA